MARRPGAGRRELVVALETLAFALVVAVISVAVKVAINQATGANAGFVIYVPAVAIGAWYRGFLGGILITVLLALADTLIFLPPLFIVALDVPNDEVRLLAFLAGGGAVSYLSHRLRDERDKAIRVAAEREQALEEAAAAREELARRVETEQRANELRDAFNSIISHELRTPITTIYGGAKVLARRDRELPDETRTELIKDLEEEADRLYRLVEDLLVLSRSERDTVEGSDDPVVVQRIAERVVRSEQARWSSITFSVESESASTARGDETFVEQVLRNLITNAAKYSAAGSAVRVVVDETDEGIRTRVLDHGVGLGDVDFDRLFDLYYRAPATAKAVSGAGIGLFVCRVLVDAMGGRIWAVQRPEGGAEFSFVLKRYEEDAP